MRARLIVTMVLFGLIVIFVLQNAATVEVQFLFWSASMPRALLIFLVMVTGMALGWVLRGIYRLTRQRGPDGT